MVWWMHVCRLLDMWRSTDLLSSGVLCIFRRCKKVWKSNKVGGRGSSSPRKEDTLKILKHLVTRADADISFTSSKRLTNHNRVGPAGQSEQTGLYPGQLKPSISDRGWKEELQQQRAGWGSWCVFLTLEHVNLFKEVSLKTTQPQLRFPAPLDSASSILQCLILCLNK